MAISTELEEALVHFQFARKIEKTETAPASHYCKTATAYLRSADAPAEDRMTVLYSELCQVVHPSAHSLRWQSTLLEGSVRLSLGDDRAQIDDLCERNAQAIESLQMQSVTISILVLRVLNRLGLKELFSPFVERLDMGNVPAWSKIEKVFAE